MATRRNLLHTAEVRERIQTSQLINQLNDIASGKREVTDHQLRSIELLLRKSMPDLKSIEHTGQVDHHLQVQEIKREIVDGQMPDPQDAPGI